MVGKLIKKKKKKAAQQQQQKHTTRFCPLLFLRGSYLIDLRRFLFPHALNGDFHVSHSSSGQLRSGRPQQPGADSISTARASREGALRRAQALSRQRVRASAGKRGASSELLGTRLRAAAETARGRTAARWANEKL